MKKKLGIRFEVIPASYKNVNLISEKKRPWKTEFVKQEFLKMYDAQTLDLNNHPNSFNKVLTG